jgi:hypothetical protein
LDVWTAIVSMCVMSLNSVDDKDSIHEPLYSLQNDGSWLDEWGWALETWYTMDHGAVQSTDCVSMLLLVMHQVLQYWKIFVVIQTGHLQRWCPCLVSLDSSSGIFRNRPGCDHKRLLDNIRSRNLICTATIRMQIGIPDMSSSWAESG